MGHYSPVPDGVLEIIEELRHDLGERVAVRVRAYASGGLTSLSVDTALESEILRRFQERGVDLKTPQDSVQRVCAY